jgi:hypothetical protein
MSVLKEVAAAAEAPLAVHALGEPGPPRFDGNLFEPERLFVLEVVYEGYLMHYGRPRAFAGMDDDMRLLAGDALYALGLRRLADAGDLEAVAELADLISACARAHAEGRAEDAEALWEASALALSLSPRRR